MKTFVRFIALGILLAGFAAAPAFGQCDPEAKQVQYDIFKANRRAKTIEGRKAAIEAGKKYVELCKDSTDDTDKEIIAYINGDIPKIERLIARDIRYQRFDETAKAKNYPESFVVAKEILENESADSKISLDLMLYLASTGLELSTKPEGSKYYEDTIKYSKMAIAAIESGKSSTEWGLFEMNYKTKDGVGSKENALGWMHFTIGVILMSQKQEKEAAEYFYKTTLIPSTRQSDPVVFNNIGTYYFLEVAKLEAVIKQKFAAQTDADTEEGKKLYAIAKAYAERGVDAFARAEAAFLKLNKKDDAAAAGEKVMALYAFRFGGKKEGKDEFVAGLLQKPLPSPSSEIVPVPEDPEPATTPTPTPSPTPSTSGN